MKRVVVHIDRLVLRGVDLADAATICASLQRDLRRLLAQPGAEAALIGRGGSALLRAGEVHVAHGEGATGLGRAAATRIVRAGGR